MQFFNERTFLLHQAQFYSTNWKYYLLPSATHSLKDHKLFSMHKSIMEYVFPNYENIYSINELFERTNFLGYFPIFIIIFTLILFLVKKNYHLLGMYKYKLIFLTIMFFTSLILSLGPDYFLSIPFFKIAPVFRYQSRYFVVALITWFALLAIFLKLLFLYTKRSHRTLFSGVLFFLFYIDFAELNATNVYNITKQLIIEYTIINLCNITIVQSNQIL